MATELEDRIAALENGAKTLNRQLRDLGVQTLALANRLGVEFPPDLVRALTPDPPDAADPAPT